MNYTIVNLNGLVESWGACREEDIPSQGPGMEVLRGTAPPTDRSRIWRWDGTAFVDDGPRFPTTYITQRLAAYPAISEQLDAIWHAMAAETAPKIEPWYSDIKAIKDAYPKP